MKKIFAILLCAILCITLFGCKKDEKKKYESIPGLDTTQEVTLKILTPIINDVALTNIANDFMNIHSNVNVSIEYLDNYDSIAKAKFKEGLADIIFSRDIKCVEDNDQFYYNFYNDPDIDMSATNEMICINYTHLDVDEAGTEYNCMYAVPLGGEVRGVFVNKSLLNKYGLATPTNYTELLECCEVLQQNGLVAIQGNPSTSGRGLGIPQCFKEIVNDPEKLEILKNVEVGVSDLFRNTFSKLYEIAALRYYDYKAIEETGMFKNTTDLSQIMCFLGLTLSENAEIIKPSNNIGNVAFIPYASSVRKIVEDLIKDNELDTEIEFICPPINDEEDNPGVYFTPYYGICANRNSENLIWSREFVNYLFFEENIRKFADEAGIVPNTIDAITLLANEYGVDEEKDCVLSGRIHFTDAYNAYDPVSLGLVDVFKCSAEKYMVKLEKDSNGEIVYYSDDNGEYLFLSDGKGGAGTTKIYKEYIGKEDPKKENLAFCTLEYYLEKLEGRLEKYR